jgi:hypothetical protein
VSRTATGRPFEACDGPEKQDIAANLRAWACIFPKFSLAKYALELYLLTQIPSV